MRAGSVVLSKYKTVDNEYRNGLFLIIYDEDFDYNILPNYNLLGLKITSVDREKHYHVPLLKCNNNFLEHDSFVMCSKPHVIDRTSLLYFGEVSPKDLLNIYSVYRKFNYEVESQVFSSFRKGMFNEK